MNHEHVLVLGAGGHAKVVIELLRASGRVVGAIIDADPRPRELLGVPVVGGDERLEALRREGFAQAFVAVGDNHLRQKIARQVQAAGYRLVNALSPAAVLSPSAQVGVGVALMAGAVVNAEARIGDLAIVNTGARIDHDCVLGEACHAGPGAALAGGVEVGPLAFLGVGACVIPQIRIGAAAIVGAGACVTRDILPRTVAVGAPARAIRTLAAEETLR